MHGTGGHTQMSTARTLARVSESMRQMRAQLRDFQPEQVDEFEPLLQVI
jgi:hypothetical protein